MTQVDITKAEEHGKGFLDLDENAQREMLHAYVDAGREVFAKLFVALPKEAAMVISQDEKTDTFIRDLLSNPEHKEFIVEHMTKPSDQE